jgi:hypothetical protein
MRTMPAVAALISGLLAASLFAGPKDPNAKANIQRFEKLLQARYAPTSLSSNKLVVTRPGAVLVLQKPGLGASPVTEFAFGNSYKGGQIRHGFTGSLIHNNNTSRDLQAGEGVYLVGFEVKDTGVVFHVQSCGECNAPEMADPLRAVLTFQFPKGYLNSFDFTQIAQTIDEVFTLAGENSASAAENAPPAGTQDTQPAAPEPQPMPQTAPAQAAPVTITLGQTTDQVVAALGQPQKLVKLGEKQLYFYKDLRVTFLDGKVSDVQ